MAQVNFLKPGQKSIKRSIPSGVYRKRWKIAFLISGALNVLFAYNLYINFYHNFRR